MKRAIKNEKREELSLAGIEKRLIKKDLLIKKLRCEIYNLKSDVHRLKERISLSKKIDPDLLTALLYCANYKAESRLLAKKIVRLEEEIAFLNTMHERTKP